MSLFSGNYRYKSLDIYHFDNQTKCFMIVKALGLGEAFRDKVDFISFDGAIRVKFEFKYPLASYSFFNGEWE